MRLHLTDLAVRKLLLTEKGQTTYWDSSTPGFGVRCSARSKSYVVMFGPNRRLKTIGRYSDVSLSDARRIAKRYMATAPFNELIKPQHQYETVLEEYLEECAELTCAPKTPPNLCRVRPTKGRTNEGTIYG